METTRIIPVTKIESVEVSQASKSIMFTMSSGGIIEAVLEDETEIKFTGNGNKIKTSAADAVDFVAAAL